MEYTVKLFVDFLKKTIIFDKELRSMADAAGKIMQERSRSHDREWASERSAAAQSAEQSAVCMETVATTARDTQQKVLLQDIRQKENTFSRLQAYKAAASLVSCAEDSISNKEVFNIHCRSFSGTLQPPDMTLEDILQGKINFAAEARKVNDILRLDKKRNTPAVCAGFRNLCRTASAMLNQEITALQAAITENLDKLHKTYASLLEGMEEDLADEWSSAEAGLDSSARSFSKRWKVSRTETERVSRSSGDTLQDRRQKLESTFLKQFPPKALADEYDRLYALEPSFANYACSQDMPRNVHIATLEYDLSPLELSEDTKAFLGRHYACLYRGNKLHMPYCASFGPEFNYLFRFGGEGRPAVVKNACGLAMRLFMMLPPGKLNFTFIDPVTLGESFAMFTRLVDVDDRSSEVINGKIWSTPSDVEEKLKIMTDHISNVTQRCLQGKFDNIFEYNQVAEQNAEAYQVLMLMDFPAGLTDQSLKLLEQIVTSGPKCGVFTVIYRSENQYNKVSEKLYPAIANIEASFQVFNCPGTGEQVFCTNGAVKEQPFLWQGCPQPEAAQLDNVIAVLKKGIKSADKVVIDIEKVNHAETTHSTKDGIRIPIGIHGANEVQYLTLGVGGSHHALIAGVAGSGKSSLLHTIILRALTQYSPEELSIYLVDFKRGVEFKIYADFVLPSFKVVAIESEREFGYNILAALEREQKIRADLFKKSRVDKIEEYRELGKKMPRVLVIMDEFHELFSSANDDLAKKSAMIMERIVRQGRAFGVHMILASQSYSNITGIDRAVFDQMTVRIVLKCSKSDANLLLDNGSSEIDQISIDDPGRAVYNSEAGNKEYNSHFRVAYIDPAKHRGMLQEISDTTRPYADPKQPTRILLSNIEDNNYSIFNQFSAMAPGDCPTPGSLYIGEPLSVTNNMAMDLTRAEYSNLLMIGGDTEKARSMFAFSILSLCINYWTAHRRAPEKPFITLFNCKPLDDSYFKDTPKLLAEFLPEYIRYAACGDTGEVQSIISGLCENIQGKQVPVGMEQYFLVFGYQRAEELKSESKLTQSEDIDSLFNIMPSTASGSRLSPKEMFRTIVKDGAQKGVHTILWQDSFQSLYQDDKDMMSYFALKVAFDMTPEEYSRFVGANDTALMSDNNAIYYNRARDNQKFRPYQAPDEDWLKDISEKLK